MKNETNKLDDNSDCASDLSFEHCILELEKIVESIEKNDSDIEKSLEEYQRGMKLINFCQDRLDKVDQQIKILNTTNDELENFSRQN